MNTFDEHDSMRRSISMYISPVSCVVCVRKCPPTTHERLHFSHVDGKGESGSTEKCCWSARVSVDLSQHSTLYKYIVQQRQYGVRRATCASRYAAQLRAISATEYS